MINQLPASVVLRTSLSLLALTAFLMATAGLVEAYNVTDDKNLRATFSSYNLDNPHQCSRGVLSGNPAPFASWIAGASNSSGQIDFPAGTIPPGNYQLTFRCKSAPVSTQSGNFIQAVSNLSVAPAPRNIGLQFSQNSANPLYQPLQLNIRTDTVLVNHGGYYTLSWTLTGTNAVSATCTASNSWSGPRQPNGSIQMYNNSNADYVDIRDFTLTCNNGVETKNASVFVYLDYC